jgi:anti-sigma factor NepR-like protein
MKKPVKPQSPRANEASGGGDGAGLNREIQHKIGQQLRAIYDDVVQEGVPDRFANLLRAIDKQSPEGQSE